MTDAISHRGLFEGPEWEEHRSHIEARAERFDEQFAAIALSLSRDPFDNSDWFFDDEEYRVMVTRDFPNAPETWIYYRIEDANNVELLWIIQPRGWMPPQVH